MYNVSYVCIYGKLSQFVISGFVADSPSVRSVAIHILQFGQLMLKFRMLELKMYRGYGL